MEQNVPTRSEIRDLVLGGQRAVLACTYSGVSPRRPNDPRARRILVVHRPTRRKPVLKGCEPTSGRALTVITTTSPRDVKRVAWYASGPYVYRPTPFRLQGANVDQLQSRIAQLTYSLPCVAHVSGSLRCTWRSFVGFAA